MNKKLLSSLLTLNVLCAFTFTPSIHAFNTKNPAQLATISVGAVMAVGGIHWCVKSNKNEGCIKRSFRTVSSLGLIVAGVLLIIKSERLNKKGFKYVVTSLANDAKEWTNKLHMLFNGALGSQG